MPTLLARNLKAFELAPRGGAAVLGSDDIGAPTRSS
jgi:hypothetical protein